MKLFLLLMLACMALAGCEASKVTSPNSTKIDIEIKKN